MAFEAFVAAGAARRDRAQRVGAAVSLALHLPPLVLFALQLVVRPTLTERIDWVPAAGGSPVVPVRIAGLRLPPTPAAGRPAARVSPAATAAPLAQAQRAPRRPRHTPDAPRIAPPAIAGAGAQVRLPDGGDTVLTEAQRHPVAPVAPPPLPASDQELERRAAAVGTEILAGLSAESGSAPALSLSAVPYGGGDPVPRSGPSQELSAGAAAYLRTYETFPSLPDSSWTWSKHTYVFQMKVCVADSGQVDDVIIQRGARPDLDAYLAAAIHTWRYRPWIVSGAARPFCHPLRITYSRG